MRPRVRSLTDNNRVELCLSLLQLDKDVDQITTHCAADAAVVHLEDFLLRIELVPNERIVYTHFSKFIFYHGNLTAGRE